MVAGHLREQNGYFQMILSWKGADGMVYPIGTQSVQVLPLFHKQFSSPLERVAIFYAFFNGQAMLSGLAHILFYIVKEDDTMLKNAPVVRCVFESAERALPELLEESFRLYLHRILAGYGKATIQ